MSDTENRPTEPATPAKPARKPAAKRAAARAAHPSTAQTAKADTSTPAPAAAGGFRLVTWDEDGSPVLGLELSREKHDDGTTVRVVPLPAAVGLDAERVKAHKP